jgi:hypothetical protein
MPRKVGGSGHLKHERWTVLTTPYDDGGFSSGTMARPALKHLIADIKAGKIDVVVVYKVDRLTQALSDFGKLVEVFDRHGASFVSATQPFIPPRAWDGWRAAAARYAHATAREVRTKVIDSPAQDRIDPGVQVWIKLKEPLAANGRTKDGACSEAGALVSDISTPARCRAQTKKGRPCRIDSEKQISMFPDT